MVDHASRFLTLSGGLIMVVVLLLALRWTFGDGRHQLAPHIPDPDDPTGDGLLTEVARVPSEAAAQALRSRLGAADVRATLGRVDGGFRLLVFHHDVATARLVLAEGPPGKG